MESTGRAVVDRLLSDKTLRLLRRFLQQSTFYFYPRPGYHLLALLEDGLASPLLAQLVDGLRNALPKTLGSHTLTGVRAWKADNSPLEKDAKVDGPELEKTSKEAAVSMLLWVVPEKALNGTSSNALHIYRRDQTEDEAEPVALIKYAQNRAVFWDQSLKAIWKGPEWNPGFLNRGIHLLLTFGWSEEYCEA
eukprot:TRINITY_DN5003_c0_g1_i1.p1 TRINITY_DN5003_c0_g1~~TRINITY_DN5003_c0_g1_i1.p1  ORF type:complete len:192 (+),score=39.50 TRINITY_DN5003_c0_g1_i1:2-577(+)